MLRTNCRYNNRLYISTKRSSLDMKKDSRKTALMLSYVVPDLSGNGLAMRAGNFLEALLEEYTVTLVVISASASVHSENAIAYWNSKSVRIILSNTAPLLKKRITNFTLLTAVFNPKPKLMLSVVDDAVIHTAKDIANQDFDLVFVSRLRMIAALEVLRKKLSISTKKIAFDLDDIESIAHHRRTKVAGVKNLGRLMYFSDRIDAIKLRIAEATAYAKSDYVFVCSQHDKAILERRFNRRKIFVIPNIVRTRETFPFRESGPSINVLFVGSLDYLPNDDAVRWLINEIIPLYQLRLKNSQIKLTVVGKNPPAWMRSEAADGRFILHGDVNDVSPFYEFADIVLVPIRAGGGTRIKILEAFSLGRPVISTTVGAEGLLVTNGEHLVIADTAEQFAEKIGQFCVANDFLKKMVGNALNLVRYSYSYASFRKALYKSLCL